MRTSDDRAVIDWLIGLFPVVPRRGTRLAFMFTDLEGFTAHAAVRGNGAALRLLGRHDSVVLPAIRALGGRIVKRLGDGLMAVFPSPADALRAAVSIQAAAARRRPAVRLRIGVHAGEVRRDPIGGPRSPPRGPRTRPHRARRRRWSRRW